MKKFCGWPIDRFKMTSIPFKSTLFTLVVLILWVPVPNAAGLQVTPESQYQYARTLTQSQKWASAIHEYERFLHFFGEHRLAEPSQFYLGQALLAHGKPDRAAEALQTFLQLYPGSSLRGRALLITAQALETAQKPDQALSYFKLAANSAASDRLKDQARLQLSRMDLRQGRYDAARKQLSAISEGGQLRMDVPGLIETLDQFKRLPRKNPTTAGWLAIIPGLGHAYCERYREALIAFVINAALVAVAVEAFDQDLPALGATAAVLEVGVYSGNIFSAVNNAHRYNRNQKNAHIQRLLQKLNFQLSMVPEDTGISLTMALSFD